MKNLSTLFFLFIAFTSFFKANAQQLYFYLNNGSMQQYAIEEVRRMDFDSTNINLHLTDQSVVSFELDALDYYSYTADDVTAISGVSDRPLLSFFPNPTDNLLNVKYSFPKLVDKIQVSIHNLSGVKLLEKEMKAEKQGDVVLDVNTLSAGQYFCTFTAGEFVITKAFMKR